MEHSCYVCGRALGRAGAPPDPIYHLPVVVCPGCATACVRRRHPIGAWWRNVRRGLTTGAGLAWRAIACFLMVVVSVGVCAMLSESFNKAGPAEVWRMWRDGVLDAKWMEAWQGDNGPLIAGIGLAWCVAVGAALTAGFGHIRRRWMMWVLFVGALVGLPALVGLDSFASQAMYRQKTSDPMPSLAACFSPMDQMWGWIALGLVVAVAGMPLGRALRRAFNKGDAKRWGAMRRRARRRRIAP